MSCTLHHFQTHKWMITRVNNDSEHPVMVSIKYRLFLNLIRQLQNMKTLLPALSLLLLIVARNAQCPIPPNCQTFSVSQNICTACQKNYLLIGNNCINTFASSPVISGLAAPMQTYTYTLANNQAIASTPAISVSSISQPASANNIPQFFIPWYTALQSTSSNTQTNTQGNTQASSTTSTTNSNAAASETNYTDYNCKTADQSNTICLECYSFFYFNTTQGKCAPVNPLCKNYTSQNQCTQCYSGYQLNNGNCTLNPTTTSSQQQSNGQNSQGQNQQAPSSSDNNCANFTNGVCSQCFQSYYYNTTLNKCMQLNPNCKTATTSNVCTSCYTGYKINPNNGDCVLQSIDIPSTASASTATATTTQAGNQYVTVNGLIYQISPQGQVTGPIYLPSTTTNTNSDPNCASFSNGQCISCANRYYLTSSGCKMVDQYCQNWNTNGLCTQCQNGYGVVNGACFPVVFSNPANFIATVNSPTTPSVSPTTSTAQTSPQCYTRQVLINNSCVDVSPYCSTWNTSDAKCTSCYTGYRLSTGSCILA